GLASLMADPLTSLVGRLAGGGALIYVLVEGAKRAPFFAGQDFRLYLLALALGVAAGLLGVVEPMPAKYAFAGEVFAGLGAGTLAITVHSGRKAAKRKRSGGES